MTLSIKAEPTKKNLVNKYLIVTLNVFVFIFLSQLCFNRLCPSMAEEADNSEMSTEPSASNDMPIAEEQMSKEQADLIKKIEITGNKRISSMIILSRIQTKEGNVLSEKTIREDIKNIYALGYFSNISVNATTFEGGKKLTYIVEEKPYADKIEFKGNRVLKEEEIGRVMAISAGDIYVEKTLEEDIKRIAELYEKKGYYKTEITPQVDVKKEENRVSVLINIYEGPRTKVKKIKILGNEHIPEKQIKAKMETKEARFFRRGIFGKEEFNKDIDRIVTVCQTFGYLDAKVTDYDLEYQQDGRLLFITIEIDEGPLYTVKEVDTTGNELFETEELLVQIQLKEGEPYNPYAVAEDIGQLRSFYAKKGYIVTQIWDEPSIDKESKEVKITYYINEGPKTYVRLIKIAGNTRTKDNVIRRELTIKPGEEFDGDKIKRSREKLYNLGYFEAVKVYTEATDKPELRDLVFEVEEKKTGALTFGIGYSTIEDLVGFIQLEQNNFDISNAPSFAGGGQKIKAKARLGALRGDYILSFTEPYFMGYPLSVGFDLYDSVRYWSAYTQKNTGGNIRIGKRITDYVKLNTTYKYEVVNISDVDSDASDAIKSEKGEFATSSLTTGLVRDTRDNAFIPTQGFLGGVSVGYAGGFLGGDRNFTKYVADTMWFYPVVKKEEYEQVISLHLRAGITKEFADSDNVPINERFFIGGADTIRGYPERGVGPKDKDDYSIGGKSFFVANVEYTFPIWKRVIRGALFYDTGNAWEEHDEMDFNDLASGIGVGLRIQSPIGPVSLDYGYSLEDNVGRLHFSMGYSF